MQNIRFSGIFTVNTQDRQTVVDARDKCVRALTNAPGREQANNSGLLFTTIEAEGEGDKFHLLISPSNSHRAATKDVNAMEKSLKTTFKNENIQFEYSPSHKGLLGRAFHSLQQLVNK